MIDQRAEWTARMLVTFEENRPDMPTCSGAGGCRLINAPVFPGVHPTGTYHRPMNDDDFRQLTFAESQIQLALPPHAQIVDLTPDGERRTRLMVMHISAEELHLSLMGFEAADSPPVPGWLAVRIPGLSKGYDVALVTLAADQVSVN